MTVVESTRRASRQYQLQLDGITIDVICKRIQHLHITVQSPMGHVRVSAPARLADDVVHRAIAARLEWIRRKRAEVASREHLPPLDPASRERHRRQLKARIPPLLAHWEAVIGVKVTAWGVKQMRTKWGTCNIRARRIWLNLELDRKPEPCLEYILVHELVHLLERGHNARFRAFMDKFLPDWRARRAALG